MIVGGHISCGYCSAVIAELEPWPAGERREFVCPECGCVNYATPVIKYKSSTYGRELWRAIGSEVQRRGGDVYITYYDEDSTTIRLDGTTALMYVCFDGPTSARVDGLHVIVKGRQIPLSKYAGMEPDEAAKVIVDRVGELGHATEGKA